MPAAAASPEFAERASAAAADFPLFVPRGYLARIRPADPHDPLLRQVLPVADEMAVVAGYTVIPSMMRRPSGRRDCCKNIRAGPC